MSLWGQLSLQDGSSLIMENMIMFHDHVMMIIMMIIMMIMYMLMFMFKNKLINLNLLEGQMIEIVWTVIPMIFLLFLVVPSLKILYLTDELNNSMITIKVVGHQWYWSYEYTDFYMVNFDSFMINDFDNKMMFRLLDVDNRLIIPMNNQIRFLVNSSDVIHSFAMPSLGMKVDAVPGRMNQVSMMINRYGLYYGQCSEICGVNHSFMPIVIEVTSMNNFVNWLKNF
uniref:Cytochrome c oxidase subunit 2 n=1 Tax=Megaphragma amalphitanum TaxID=1735703 RepID=A0A0N7HUM7_9HYME|nr:cytochrome c oxidase subunit II [Megaphragma amalphitanum]ALI86574.1 cytochrome c oxidase subunit 2 [Megaphragma amalphitanum]